MRYFKTILCTAILTLSYAATAEATLPLSSGVYTDFNAGAGFNGDNFGSHFNTFSQWFGASADLGYKVNMFFGLEVGAAHYPDAVVGNEKNTGTLGWDVAGKIIMPFDNGVELFGKLGYTKLYQKTTHAPDPANDGNHQGGTALAGLGVSFYGSSHWALTLQGTATKKMQTIPSQYLATLGITYIF